MTLIIITGEIDISVGSIVGLCASTMAVCLEHHLPVEAAMAIGLAVGTLCGIFNGVIIVGFGLPSLVVTIGTLALYRGIAQIILKERGVNTFPDLVSAVGLRHDRADTHPLERADLPRRVCRVRLLPAHDLWRPGALRHRQQ